jgi:4-amino-4-deoxy-L-arabinose transferase-like glycosyltransferase
VGSARRFGLGGTPAIGALISSPVMVATRDRPLLGPAFLALLGLALVLRLGFVLATLDYQAADDPGDYHRLAISISEGNGFGESLLAAAGGPTAFRAPLFPAFLGAVYANVGPRVNAARIVLAGIGTVTVALIGVFAFRLFGRRVGLAATSIAAVYPSLLLMNGTLITESVFVPLELGAFLAVLRFRRDHADGESLPWRWLVLAGALSGLTALSRQVGLLLIATLALLVLARTAPGRRPSWLAPTLLVATAVAVVAPWTIRNLMEMHSPMVVTDDDGFVFAGVFNDNARNDPRKPGIWRPPSVVPEHAALFEDPSLNEAELSRELRSRALRYLAGHPGYGIFVFAQSVRALFELQSLDLNREAAKFIGYGTRTADAETLGWALVGILAVCGAFTRAARRAPPTLWLTPILFTAATAVVLGTPRYRAPMEPFIVVLASLAVVAAFEKVRPIDRVETA